MLVAVVGRCIISTHNGHRRIDRRDDLVTVRNIKRHRREVRIGVGELVGSEAHIGLAVGVGAFHHIGSGSGGRTVEGEIRLRIERSADVRHRIAAHAVLAAVIRRCILSTHDGHRRVDRCDGLVTIRHVEDHRTEVRVVVGKLVQRTSISTFQTHIGSTRSILVFHHISSRSRSSAVESKVSLGVERIADGDIVTRYRVLLTVVCGGVMMTGNGHHHLTHSRDGLVAVHNIEGHLVEVRRIRVGELLRIKTHIGGTCHRTFRRNHIIHQSSIGSWSEREVCSGIERVTVGHIVARHHMFLTIKGGRVLMTGDGHRHVDLIDGLVTVGHIEGHRTEVRVVVGKLVQRTGIGTLQAHVGGTCIGALGGDDTVH